MGKQRRSCASNHVPEEKASGPLPWSQNARGHPRLSTSQRLQKMESVFSFSSLLVPTHLLLSCLHALLLQQPCFPA